MKIASQEQEIRRRNTEVFVRSLINPGRLIVIALACMMFTVNFSFWVPIGAILVIGAVAYTAYESSIPRRFRDRRFLQHWTACHDRLKRFDQAVKALHKRKIASLEDLPKNIHQLAETLYVALRRADQVAYEVHQSEGKVPPPVGGTTGLTSEDRQAQELYRVADRNLAEYRRSMQSVMGGIHRTEAQAVVFVTTLDTLRVKMLGHRITGRNIDTESSEFLHSIVEAKMQLDAIDKALEEIELTPCPKTVTILESPPPVPTHEPQQQQQETES